MGTHPRHEKEHLGRHQSAVYPYRNAPGARSLPANWQLSFPHVQLLSPLTLPGYRAGAGTLRVSALERIRRRYNFVVAGYVVMPEHVHLLVSEPRKGLLARAVQALKLSVSVRRVERPFWQARYYDFNVWSARKRIEKLRYMHRNPGPPQTDFRLWGEIPLCEGEWRSRKTGRGPASAITQRGWREPWRSNHRGRRRGAGGNCRLDGRCKRRMVEVRALPGLKIQTWGTHSCGKFISRDPGQPAALATSIGVSASTKLSQLTPAQLTTFETPLK